MDVITKEIEHALNLGLYYLALVCALSLPDVCAALESPKGDTNSGQYKAWYRRWVTTYPSLTPDDMWLLRCGVIHQGRLGHSRSQYARVVFTLPNSAGITMHNNIIVDALNLDLVTFCHDMIDAVNRWYSANKTNTHVVTNLPRLVQYRPNGLAPYIGGLPLIA